MPASGLSCRTRDRSSLLGTGSLLWHRGCSLLVLVVHRLQSLPAQLWGTDLVAPRHMGSYGSPGDAVVKNPHSNAGDMGSILGSGRSSGAGNGHSNITAWEIPWTEETTRLPSNRFPKSWMLLSTHACGVVRSSPTRD